MTSIENEVEVPEAEVAEVDTTVALIASKRYGDGSKVSSVEKLTELAEKVSNRFGSFLTASRELAEGKREIGELIMDARLSVVLKNGQPDFYGASKCWIALRDDYLIPALATRYEASVSEVKALLNTVTTNYVNREEMVAEKAILHAVYTGDLKNRDGSAATVVELDDGKKRVEISAPTADDPDRVLTYTTGQEDEVPAVIKNVVKKLAVKNNKNLKPRFGGEEKGKTDVDLSNVENPMDGVTDGFATVLANVWTPGHPKGASPADSCRAFHSAFAEWGMSLVGEIGKASPGTIPGGKEQLAPIVSHFGDFVNELSRVLAGRAEKDELAGLIAPLAEIES